MSNENKPQEIDMQCCGNCDRWIYLIGRCVLDTKRNIPHQWCAKWRFDGLKNEARNYD